MKPPILLAVPNVSEGRDETAVAALAAAFAGTAAADGVTGALAGSAAAAVRLLDVHTDRDHHRSVFTLAGPPVKLADVLLRGAHTAVEQLNVMERAHGHADDAGQHPHVGAIDVVPIVYLSQSDRGAACAEALVVADRLGSELDLPVFLYGELSGADPGSERTRAQLRRGGIAGLAARMVGEVEIADGLAPAGAQGARAGANAAATTPLVPDFGPHSLHPRAGAALVAARPPLVAFNLQLAPPATIADARAIAARIREGGEEGLPGVRAIAVALGDGSAQVSTNVERPNETALARVVDAVRTHALIASAELVGLAPAAAFAGFPEDLPIPGFDPARHLLENALGS